MPELAMNTLPSRRLDFSRYDRTPGFTEREQLRIAAVAEGESLHLRLDDRLARLLDPLKACLRPTEAQPFQHSLLRHLLTETHASQTVFWAWREEAWTSVYHRCKEARTAANTLQHVLAMAALLCGVDLPKLRNQERRILRRRSPAIKVFGREEVDQSIGKVETELKRLGYTGYFHLEVRNALCELFWFMELLTLRHLRLSRFKGCDARNALTV